MKISLDTLYRKIIPAGMVAILLAVIVATGLKANQERNKFFGKEIIYKNTFKVAQKVEIVGNQIIYRTCARIPSKVIITEDTVVFEAQGHSVGYKPVSLGNEINKLIARRSDSIKVIFVRFSNPNLEIKVENEMLFIVSPEGAILLNTQDECQETRVIVPQKEGE